MKKTFIFLTLIITSFSCLDKNSTRQESKALKDSILQSGLNNEINKIDCSKYLFERIADQADSLVKFYNLAKDSESKEKLILNRKFFCSFPNSFKNMQEIFGYDDHTGAAPLYEYPIGENIITYFSNLASIPKSEYYNKYINICINGIWQADNIRNAFGFGEKLDNDCESVCPILKGRSDNEIKSIFRFIFDGPHPINERNKEIYKILLTELTEQDKKLSELFTQAYDEVMASYDGHGK